MVCSAFKTRRFHWACFMQVKQVTTTIVEPKLVTHTVMEPRQVTETIMVPQQVAKAMGVRCVNPLWSAFQAILCCLRSRHSLSSNASSHSLPSFITVTAIAISAEAKGTIF